jgi:hypothetical protein
MGFLEDLETKVKALEEGMKENQARLEKRIQALEAFCGEKFGNKLVLNYCTYIRI